MSSFRRERWRGNVRGSDQPKETTMDVQAIMQTVQQRRPRNTDPTVGQAIVYLSDILAAALVIAAEGGFDE